MKFLLKTDPSDLGALVARVALAVAIFPHGAQKALGWFGGQGLLATISGFEKGLHIPPVFAVLAIVAEFLGSIGLAVGLLSRVAAFGIATTMVVAAVTTIPATRFFMNWGGKQQGEGYEYHILAVGLALLVMLRGAGAMSLDAWLTGKRR